jgi:hypothetical protein
MMDCCIAKTHVILWIFPLSTTYLAENLNADIMMPFVGGGGDVIDDYTCVK